MNAALAAWLPVEVLDGIGHIDPPAIDSGGDQSFVEHRSGGPDKRFAGEIFFISRLLCNEEHFSMRCTFPENRLRSLLP